MFKQRLAALEQQVAGQGLLLTEAQVAALERKQDDDLAHGEIETAHPGYPGSQDTFYVGTIKGVGRMDQQTFVDTYSKVAMAKLYPTRTPITAADLLNDRVLPFLAEHNMGVIRRLTDRGTEYGGRPETHDYPLYLALNDIEHTRTKARHPQINGICEPFHKTLLQESFTRWPSAASSICRWRSYRPTSMPGSPTTTTSEPIRVRGAADARPGKP